ncbi:sugar phosphate permease [Antricoccus suffuscus]|uniref:Sugar phosphate permease n=1 Tax=Antricoccus suffuscus TaxID=1629062 RepID=A0A2T1A757_9ACTN|nr:MFS transporter [Antricoccus suffuscus]PRZ44307.1 sugar phosphate permease [Antricoccus suffuscus]
MTATQANAQVQGSTQIASSPRRRTGRAWVITVMLLVFMLINFADKAALGLAAVDITKDLGLTNSQYGLLSSGFFFLFSVAALAVGIISDRVPTKWIILVMALIWSVSQVPLIGTVGFGTLLVSRIVLGAAEGPAFPVANYAVHKWFNNAGRSLPSAIVTIGAPLGVIVGAPAITWVIVHHGWHAAFLLLAVIGLVWSVVWIFVGRDGKNDDSLVVSTAEVESTRMPTWRILTSGTWLSSVFAGFAAYWALALLVAWLPKYLETQLGYSTTVTGTLIILPWAAGALGQLLQGGFTGRMMRRGMSSRKARGILGGVCVTVSGLAMLGFIFVPTGWVKIVFMTIGFNLAGIIFALSLTVCSEISPPKQRGRVLGTYAAIYATSGIIAPYLTGRLIDAIGAHNGYEISFLITALLLIVAGVIATVFIRPERDALRLRQNAVIERDDVSSVSAA